MATSGQSGVNGGELKGGAGQRAQGNSGGNGRNLRDFHRRPHNARASRIGTKGAQVQVVHNQLGAWTVSRIFDRSTDVISTGAKESCLQGDQTLVIFLSTLRDRSVQGSEGQA